MRRATLFPVIMLLSALSLASTCDEFTGPPGQDGQDQAGPANISFTSEPTGDQEVGTSVDVTVEVTNSSDGAVSGEDVTFTVTSGGGSVSVSVVATGTDGTATTTWTFGTSPGDQSLRASVADLQAITTTATTVPGPVSTLSADPNAVEMDALGDTAAVTVTAADSFGNEISDPSVSWMSSDETVATAGDGEIVSVDNGTAEVVVSAGDAADTVDVTVRQVAVSVAITPSADTLFFQVPTQLQASAVDANGNPIDSAAYEWSSLNSSVATVDSAGNVTGQDLGSVSIQVSADTAASSVAGMSAAVTGQATFLIAPNPREAIATNRHTCVLDVNGQAWCWGYNYYGQLGTGVMNLNGVNLPQAVSGSYEFVKIYADFSHTCGLTAGGAAYCWGNNYDGQLGNGTTGDPVMSPTAVSGGMSFVDLAVGRYHTCGLTAAGEIYCWGANWAGQLGTGDTNGANVPTAIDATTTFAQVVAGRYHTCALNTSSSIFCWGDNYYGVFGNGTTNSSTSPVNVGNPQSLQVLSAGWYHTCGLNGSGQAFCWGTNWDGQIGDGTTDQRLSPVQAASGLTFDHLLAGGYHTCGLHADGTVSCWGWGVPGQLGQGAFESVASPVSFNAPGPVAAFWPGYTNTCAIGTGGAVWCSGSNWFGDIGNGAPYLSTSAVQVQSDPGLAWLTGGSNETCGMTSGGTLYCWGAAGHLLGSGFADFYAAAPTAYSGTLNLNDIQVGSEHACGLDGSGFAYCWGYNYYGQLGDGTFDDRESPVAVAGGNAFTDLFVGPYHNCGITSGGDTYCWGWNSSDQLGDGSGTDQPSPVLSTSGYTWSALFPGLYHTCAVDGAGAAYCWGANWYGQLGDGTTTSSSTPVAVSGSHVFTKLGGGGVGGTSVVMGYYHTCGVTDTGDAYCWGNNNDGQLGDGTNNHAYEPVLVTGGHTIDGMFAFGWSTCGLLSGGGLFCWGYNRSGQLGDGTFESRSAPTQAAGGMTFSDVAPGNAQTCGVATGGSTYCWGHFGWGYLGNGEIAYFNTPQTASTGSFTVPHSGETTSADRWMAGLRFTNPVVVDRRAPDHRMLLERLQRCETENRADCRERVMTDLRAHPELPPRPHER